MVYRIQVYNDAGELLGYEVVEPDDDAQIDDVITDVLHAAKYRERAAYGRAFANGNDTDAGEPVAEVWQ